GRDRVEPDADRAQVAGTGEGQPDDARLGGGVGTLAHLSLVAGDGGGGDDRAALTVLVRLVRRHPRRRQSQHVVGAGEVELHGPGEAVDARRTAVAIDDLLRDPPTAVRNHYVAQRAQ